MSLIVLLFAIGIVLIAVEVIVPGAILGSIGAVMIFAGCVIAFRDFGPVWGALSAAAAFAIGGLAIFLEFWILPKTAIGKRAFLKKEITAVATTVGNTKDLIGKPAEAVTLLSPSGYVRVDGKRYEAFCESGQAPVGAALEIIGADNFRLIVTQRPIS